MIGPCKLLFVLPIALLAACGDKAQDNGCEPGHQRCSQAGHVETCDPDGQAWSQTEECAVGCDQGTCLVECACNSDDGCQPGCACDPDCGQITVQPPPIDDLLVNPGMGSADFHFRWWCNLPPVTFTPEQCVERWNPEHESWPLNMPAAGTAYFRWHWADIEPERGVFDWELIDRTIQTANLLGETLAFRIMTIDDGALGVPAWLTQAPYSVPVLDFDGTVWPDYRDATFQAEHARMVAALAARYDQHPGVDHVDIGAVGCWGEWNTACLDGVTGIFEVFSPQTEDDYQAIVEAYQALISHYTDTFVDTPLVMLELGSQGGHDVDVMVHALARGTGWRVDCWGDWWNFGPNWSHHDNLYPAMIANMTAAYPAFPDTWQHAPVQLEICGTMPGWYDLGYTTEAPDGAVYKSFQWALDQHASLLNLKSTDIHDDYVDSLHGLLRQNGYRFEIDSLSHPEQASPGDDISVSMAWSNTGVAPTYNRRTLSVRLHSADRQVTFDSDAGIRQWLPGSHQVSLPMELPADMPVGDYHIDVALRDRAATEPDWAPLPPLQLGTAGRLGDGWYRLSTITIAAAD